MKFRGKNKVSNIMWAKLCSLIGRKHQNSFQYKLMQKISLSVSSTQASKHLVSGFPFSLMNDIHKPFHKKKNYLKYFALTAPLPWKDLCESVKVKKILKLHFRSACLLYFEIHLLSAPRNVTFFFFKTSDLFMVSKGL